jgi:hypothetical protein
MIDSCFPLVQTCLEPVLCRFSGTSTYVFTCYIAAFGNVISANETNSIKMSLCVSVTQTKHKADKNLREK